MRPDLARREAHLGRVDLAAFVRVFRVRVVHRLVLEPALAERVLVDVEGKAALLRAMGPARAGGWRC